MRSHYLGDDEPSSETCLGLLGDGNPSSESCPGYLGDGEPSSETGFVAVVRDQNELTINMHVLSAQKFGGGPWVHNFENHGELNSENLLQNS